MTGPFTDMITKLNEHVDLEMQFQDLPNTTENRILILEAVRMLWKEVLKDLDDDSMTGWLMAVQMELIRLKIKAITEKIDEID